MTEQTLADAILRHSLQILRLGAGQADDAEAILIELTRELKLLLDTADLTDAGKRDIEKLIAQADEAIRVGYLRAGAVSDTHSLAIIVAEHTQRVMEDVIPAVVKLPTASALLAIGKDVLIDGAPSSAWWAKQSEDLQFKFAAAVRQGLANNETQEQIVTRIVGKRGEPGIMDRPRRDARALVHSSVLSAANQARLATFRKNARLLKGVKWLSTLDSHTCLQCAALDGAAWNLDGEKLPGTTVDFSAPPKHFGCFPEGTRVLSRREVTGASKRWFNGEVVVIKTAAGRELTCTPNHPILTDGGWVAAHLLDVGSNVVCDGGSEWEGSVDGDGEDVPASIHHVAESFLASRQMFAMPVEVSPEDFHGDGAGSEIAIVWSDSLLRRNGDSPCFKHFRQSLLVSGSLAGLVGLAGSGRQTLLGERLGPTSGGGIRGGGKGLPLMLGGTGHTGELLFAPAAHGDAIFVERGDDRISGRPKSVSDAEDAEALLVELDRLGKIELGPGGRDGTVAVARAPQARADGVDFQASLVSNLLACFPSKVLLDQVVSADRIQFVGHVYNLETNGGWYVAQGLVVHNCRCILSPVPKTFKDIGLNIPEPANAGQRASSEGPIAGDTTFDQFLKRQSPEFIAATLGKRRAELFSAGKLTLRDLISGTGRALTLDELRNH